MALIGALAILAFLFFIFSCFKAAGEWDDRSENEDTEIDEAPDETYVEHEIVNV